MPGEPIVMLHVALTTDIVSNIAEVIKKTRQIKRFQTMDAGDGHACHAALMDHEEDPALATTAIFYSISSTQEGLQASCATLCHVTN